MDWKMKKTDHMEVRWGYGADPHKCEPLGEEGEDIVLGNRTCYEVCISFLLPAVTN